MSFATDTEDHERSHPAARLVRPIGALERFLYRYAERNPMHFSLVAEFDTVLDAQRLRTALTAVQRRHPLLSTHVEDRPGIRLGFYRRETAAPIPLTEHHPADGDWQPLVARELSQPFDRSVAPLVRMTLVTNSAISALVLTFDHTVADGISSLDVLNDLVAALNGEILSALPVPPTQEDIIASTFTVADRIDLARADADTPRRLASTIRPFDGTTPHLHRIAISEEATARLARRCRAEQTTVHSAIATAASRVRGQQRGEHHVGVFTPINFRALIAAGDDCVDYFTAATTALTPADGSRFWDQARAVSGQLAVLRSAAGIATISEATQQLIPIDATVDTAEQFLLGALASELLISNLGVHVLDALGPIRPTAIWGPLLLDQVDGDYVVGVVTYGGQLRMTACGYTPVKRFLDEVSTDLLAAMG